MSLLTYKKNTKYPIKNINQPYAINVSKFFKINENVF